jgi:UDP-N-acetylglucosamine--N-acetylmuramyl-(pentapeptide) pyrophosphoryl-undecaprenol N-acetylglucosamine transferase
VIVLTGGGTGGHLEVARLLKEAFRARGVTPIFIGSTRGQDQRWFDNDDGFAARYFFDTRGVVDRGPAGGVVSLALIVRATVTALGVLKRHAAKAVVNVGSYAAAPASLAALLRRIPLFIHEPSAVVSPLNRLLRPYAAGFFSSYGDESPVPDFPVDRAFFDLARPRTRLGRILFLGGRQRDRVRVRPRHGAAHGPGGFCREPLGGRDLVGAGGERPADPLRPVPPCGA